MTNIAFRRQARAVSCCAGLILLSASMPAFAQLGQSEFVPAGAPDAETDQIARQQQTFTQGISPGKGWTPPKKFGGGTMQQPQMAPIQQQPAMQQQGGYPADDGGGSGWADIQHKTHNGYGISDPNAGMSAPPSSAFQAGQAAPQQDWSLPAAQEGEQWQQGMQQGMQQAMQQMPKPTAPKPVTAVKPAAKPVAQQKTMSGHVTQNANAQQFPTSQFNPNMGTMGGGNMAMPLQGQNMAMPLQGQNMAMPMNGGGGMGMPMNGNMAMPMNGNMAMPMNGNMAMPMNGNMAMPMNGGGMGMPQQAMGGTGAVNTTNMAMPLNAGPSGGGGMGMGASPMGALGALMAGGLGGGGMGGAPAAGGNPFDAIGRAIKGAAQMGLIPGSNAQGQANVPPGYDPTTGQYGTGGGGNMGAPMGGGYPVGGSTFNSNGGGMQQGTISQKHSSGQSMGQTLKKVPGYQTVRQTTRSVNRGIQRNIPWAIDAAARRGITRALWHY